jgi:hypothetical protein
MKRLIYLKNGQSLDLLVSALKNKSSPIYLGPKKKGRPWYISAQKISFTINRNYSAILATLQITSYALGV